jgi:chaperonin GroEL
MKLLVFAIVKRAIEEPLRQIVANAGGEGALYCSKSKRRKSDFGYNARTDKYRKPMLQLV